MTDAVEDRDLLSYRISALPPSFYYIPNFISAEEETQLLKQVRENNNYAPAQVLLASKSLLINSLDSTQPLDNPLPPPPTSAPLQTHRKQHPPRRAAPTIPRRSNPQPIRETRSLQRNAARYSEPCPAQRIQERRRHYDA